MLSKLKTTYQNSGLRHHQRVVAFAILGILVGSLLAVWLFPGELTIEQNQMKADVEEVSEKVFGTSTEPMRLLVPEISLDTTFEDPLGVNNDRTIEVPEGYEEVAYYKYGPIPGEIGPAVILGHVDSYEGPAVFYRLRELEVGDLIEVVHENGATSTFAVTSAQTHKQSGFPTEAVYSDLDHAGLRLITCTGTFNHGEQVYSHNLIIFAELVE